MYSIREILTQLLLRVTDAEQHAGALTNLYFGTVYIDGSAALFNSNFEALDDDHIGGNM
jgi:hypothetical protein